MPAWNFAMPHSLSVTAPSRPRCVPPSRPSNACAAPGGLWDVRRGHDRPDAVLAANAHLGYADRLTWPSAATPARSRRIIADDVHRFILVGQAIVPTWFFSRPFGDRPAQDFRGRPWLARLVADEFDLGAATYRIAGRFQGHCRSAPWANPTMNSALRCP